MKKSIKNPRPRIGTANAKRRSSITGKAPSARLVRRRRRNVRKGYFPNPERARALQESAFNRIPHRKRRVSRKRKASAENRSFKVQSEKRGAWYTICTCYNLAHAKDVAHRIAKGSRARVRVVR